MESQRGPIVVTGTGAVSAWGWGVAPFLEGLRSGGTAIRALERFAGEGHRTAVAAEVPPAKPGMEGRFPAWARFSLAERFALAAAVEAVEGAGAREPALGADPAAVGVFFGGSTAGMLESEELVRPERRTAPEGEAGQGAASTAPPEIELLAAQPLDAPAGAVARHFAVAGPVVTVSSACASGTQGLGLALEALRSGEVDVALAGGADSLCRLTYAGFNALRVVGETACRPFREGRDGMTLGEGAGVLVLETEARARRRGAPALARLLGVGNSCDAHHMTAPHPEGLGAALAIERAFRDAGLLPEGGALDFVNAHGTGTPLNDLSEWRGMLRVLGEAARRVPVTATKASVGHLLGSSGAIEAVATVLGLSCREVYPTAGAEPDGTDALDPECPAHLVTGGPRSFAGHARRGAGGGLALSTSFGFGGANAAALFGPAGAGTPERESP